MNSLGKTTNSSVSPASLGNASTPPPLPPRDDEIARLTEINRSLKIKIQALIQEVAYLRRIRYGAKSEAMSAEQRSLFEEDIALDIAAVDSELKLPSTPITPRTRAGRQALPEHLERVDACPELVEGCATNRNPAPAQAASASWLRSAKMSANNWILNRHASS